MINKAFKYRIYPTEIQKQFLSKQFGGARFVYNYFLNQRKEYYFINKKSLSYYDNAKELTVLKQQDGYDWLYETNAQSIQQSLRHLETAYTNFFSKRSMFPKFKKKTSKQSVCIPQNFSIYNKKLNIPKLKFGIKINLKSNQIPKEAKILNLTISKTSTDKYYASFCCEIPNFKSLTTSSKKVGMDLGLADLMVLSDETKIPNLKFHHKLEKKLKHLHKKLSKKNKGSNNHNKARVQLSLIYETITNRRNDFIHKLTSKLINENQVIIAEDLSVKNMLQNHCMAKSIQNALWGEIVRQLKYKAQWYGRTFHQINRFFPSSKTCNDCKYVVDKLPLKIREWNCPKCGVVHDRDINAAKNILEQGLNDMSVCGLQSDNKQKLVEALLMLDGSMKQETKNF